VGSLNQENGSFRALIPPGSYWVKVTAEGYLPFDTITSLDFADYFAATTGADTDVTGVVEGSDPPEPVDCVTLTADVPL